MFCHERLSAVTLIALLFATSNANAADRVALRSRANGKYVSVAAAAPEKLLASSTVIGTSETFELTTISPGHVGLRSAVNGKYVCAENAGSDDLVANRSWLYGWESFSMYVNSDGAVSLRALDGAGNFVTAGNAGTLPLRASSSTIGLWEKFDLVRVGSIRVAHWNIQYGRDLTGSTYSLTRTANLIRYINPDVIALLEVHRNFDTTHSNCDDQKQILETMLPQYGYSYWDGNDWAQSNCSGTPRQRGTLILSKFPLVNPRSTSHGTGGSHLLSATVVSPEGCLPFHAFHASLDIPQRASEISSIRPYVDSSGPGVLVGDFNDCIDLTTMTPLAGMTIAAARSGPGYVCEGCSFCPTSNSIDLILTHLPASSILRWNSTDEYRDPEDYEIWCAPQDMWCMASDHPILYADIDLAESEHKPLTASRSDGSVHIAWRSSTNRIKYDRWTFATGWTPVVDLGGMSSSALASDPFPVLSGTSRVDIFWRGANGKLWRNSSDNNGASWYGETCLEDVLPAQPTGIGQTNGDVDLFWRTSSGDIGHRAYQVASGWSPTETLWSSSPAVSDPQPVVRSSGYRDVYWKGQDGNLWHLWYPNGNCNIFSTWCGPQNTNVGQLNSAPAVVGYATGGVDVFWRGYDDKLWNWPGAGSAVAIAGTTIGSAPRATQTTSNWLEVAYRSPYSSTTQQSTLLASYRNAGSWGTQQTMGTSMVCSTPSVSGSIQQWGTTDVFYRMSDSTLGHTWKVWNSSWNGPESRGPMQ
jgi:endonuclease/exonuclease/phosphatase family metal-dependent hydrolase